MATSGVSTEVDPRMANVSLEESCPLLVDVDTSAGKLHVPINVAVPQEIDTPLFRGRVLFINRQPGKWRYEHLFVGKKRTFEVQIQGTFKKPPANRLYMGVELEEAMKVGMMTRACCQAILGLLKKVARGDSHLLRWSFGEGERGAYIYFPLTLMCNVQKVTPPGATPPRLGTLDVHEGTLINPEFDRLLSEVNPKTWQQGHVFTFTWHTMYLDMGKWTLSNIPGMGTMSLETFWGKKRNLGIFIFCAPYEKAEDKDAHEVFINNKLRWVGDSPIEVSFDDKGQIKGQISSMLQAESARVASRKSSNDMAEKAAAESDTQSVYTARSHVSEDDESEDEDSQIDDNSSLFSVDFPDEDFYEKPVTPDDSSGNERKDSNYSSERSPAAKDGYANGGVEVSSLPLPGSSVSVPWYVETVDASQGVTVWFCFEWPKSASNSRVCEWAAPGTGKSWCLTNISKVLLALNTDEACRASDSGPGGYPQSASKGITDRLRGRRKSGQIDQLNFRGVSLPMAGKRRLKVQALEYVRHSLLAILGSASMPQLLQVLEPIPGSDASSWLLSSEGSADLAFAEAKSARHSVIHEGPVGSIHFEGRMCLEWLTLGVDLVLRVHAPNSSNSGPRFALELSTINVRAVPRENDFATGVLGDFFFFELCCTEKIFVFGTATEASRATWIQTINEHLMRLQSKKLSPRSTHPSLLKDLTDASRWHPRRRVVLNDRRLLLSERQLGSENLSPVELSARILGLALSLTERLGTLAEGVTLLSGNESPVSSLEAGRHAGLRKCLTELADATCLLKAVRIGSLSELEKEAFWLNIYHCLLLHGFVVLGVPMSVRELLGFHNHSSYLIGSQPFSLVEIEHGVLRAMKRPRNDAFFRLILGQWQRNGEDPLKRAGCLFIALPSERRPPDLIDLANWNKSYGVEEPDIRINYCLNCGNISNLPEIPLFSGNDECIEAQLELTSGRFLDQLTVVHGAASGPPTAISFPYTVKRWQKDIKDPAMTHAQWLKSMAKYLSPEKAARIQRTPEEKLRCKVKYLPYHWDHHKQIRMMQFHGENEDVLSPGERLSRKPVSRFNNILKKGTVHWQISSFLGRRSSKGASNKFY